MTDRVPSFGIVTMAFGRRKYVRQAEALALSIRLHMPSISISLISDNDRPNNVFDHHRRIDLSHGLGVIQKLWLDQYSPYDHTLYVDSDSLVTRSFHDELEEIRKFDFTPVMGVVLGLDDKDDFYVNDLGTAMRMVGATQFPKFNGGVYFFRRGGIATQIFCEARNLAKAAKQLGLKNFDGAGPGEETAIGLAMGKLGVSSLYYDNGRLMRTPIGMTGPLNLDVLGGGCSFMKAGVQVTPAICHFAAPYARYWPYFYNCFIVRHPHSSRTTRFLAKQYFRIQRRVINRINGQDY